MATTKWYLNLIVFNEHYFPAYFSFISRMLPVKMMFVLLVAVITANALFYHPLRNKRQVSNESDSMTDIQDDAKSNFF